MIIRLILLIALVLVLVTIVQMFKKTPKAQQKKLYLTVGLSGLAIVLILLAATGRIHWIGAMIGAAIPLIRRSAPLLIRYFPLLQQYLRSRPQPNPTNNNQSTVRTPILSMVMDHDNEQLKGDVIQGPFAGSSLDQLELPQLQNLLDYCHQQDKDSVQLLITYLNHRFGHDWQGKQQATPESLSVDSAYDVLGLAQGASKDEIIKAHKKMMQKNHPDRGGSNYIAAQINQAKDLLLSKLS